MTELTIWNTPYHPAQEVAVDTILPQLNEQIESAVNVDPEEGSREAIITALTQMLAEQLPGNAEAMIVYR